MTFAYSTQPRGKLRGLALRQKVTCRPFDSSLETRVSTQSKRIGIERIHMRVDLAVSGLRAGVIFAPGKPSVGAEGFALYVGYAEARRDDVPHRAAFYRMQVPMRRRAQVLQMMLRDAVEKEVYNLRRTARFIGGMTVPERDQHLAVAGDVRAQMGILPRAGFTGLLQVCLRRVVCERQDKDFLRASQKLSEFCKRTGISEVLFVSGERHRQRHNELRAALERNAGDKSVRPFRER